MTTSEIVYFHLDPDNPHVLTAEERQAWTELLEMGD
jgi:phosphoribosyl 1,2-cyclic phosphodiesterase